MEHSITATPPSLRHRVRALLLRQCSIPEGSLIFTVAFLLSAGLGVLRQSLFNAQFGAGAEASAYYVAVRLPETLITLVAGGTLSNALIPALLVAARDGGRAAEERLASLTVTLLTAVTALAALLGVAVAPALVHGVLAPGFDGPSAELSTLLARIVLPQTVLVVASSVAIAVLNSRRQFVITALAVVSHNLALIAGILATRAYPPLGIYGPALGVIGDAAVQLLILWPGLRASGLRLRPLWDLADRRLRAMLRLLAPNGLSAVVNFGGTIVDTAFASLAASPMAIPALYNAALLAGLPTRLIGVAVGQAAFPHLAADAAMGRWARLRRTLLRALLAVALLATLAFGAMLLLGRPVIRAIFERGQFDAAAGDLTYALLVATCVGLPAYAMTEVLGRTLIATHDTTTPLLANAGQLAVRALLIWLLLPSLGVTAIPVGIVASSVLETIALAAVLLRRLR